MRSPIGRDSAPPTHTEDARCLKGVYVCSVRACISAAHPEKCGWSVGTFSSYCCKQRAAVRVAWWTSQRAENLLQNCYWGTRNRCYEHV